MSSSKKTNVRTKPTSIMKNMTTKRNSTALCPFCVAALGVRPAAWTPLRWVLSMAGFSLLGPAVAVVVGVGRAGRAGGGSDPHPARQLVLVGDAAEQLGAQLSGIAAAAVAARVGAVQAGQDEQVLTNADREDRHELHPVLLLRLVGHVPLHVPVEREAR